MFIFNTEKKTKQMPFKKTLNNTHLFLNSVAESEVSFHSNNISER